MCYIFNICPYICSNKTEFGHCKTTACINPQYNTSIITSNCVLTQQESKETAPELPENKIKE